MTENHRTLDGNAAAGPLMELFTLDLTAAHSTCTHCGNSSPLASHDLYTDSPAIVLRCPTCAGVVLRYASTGGRIRLDFSGSRLLVLPLDTCPESAGAGSHDVLRDEGEAFATRLRAGSVPFTATRYGGTIHFG